MSNGVEVETRMAACAVSDCLGSRTTGSTGRVARLADVIRSSRVPVAAVVTSPVGYGRVLLDCGREVVRTDQAHGVVEVVASACAV